MKKILLINENEKMSTLLTFILEKSGYEIKHLIDPLDLFDMILEYAPHLVILDIDFKNFDGLYLIEKLKRDKAYEKIPVLVVSSKNEPLFLIDSVERGASDYLASPINEDLLIDKVKRLISEEIKAG